MLVDRKNSTLGERKVVKGDACTTFQMRTVLPFRSSGGPDNPFATASIRRDTAAEVQNA